MTVDDTLRQAGEILAADPTTAGSGLALRIHQALQVAAGGHPGAYVAARDRLAAHLGGPVTAWVHATRVDTTAAAAVCVQASHPVLQLVSGGDR